MSDKDNFSPQNPQPSAAPQPANGGSRPVPDPTILTTESITRQIAGLKELLSEKIDGNTSRIASALVLYESKFAGIEKQFDAIEAWRKEQKLDTKTAVDAALQAAEKAVREQTVASEKAITKSETSSTEQAKQQFATFSANLNGLSIVVNDVKERVLRIESRKEGELDTRISNRQEGLDSRTLMLAVITIVISLVGLGAAIVIATRP